MTDIFQFALGNAAHGLPLTSSSQQALQAALAGGSATAAFFEVQNSIGMLISAVNDGSAVWFQGSDGKGNPTWSALATVQDHVIQITLAGVASPSVIAGSSPPPTFSWNGNNYNVVGTFTGTITFDGVPAWAIQVPLGLSSAVAVTALAGYAWSGLIAPLITGFYQGVKSCFAQADTITTAEDAAAAGEEAAADAAVEDTIVEDAVVSLETGGIAFIAIVIIAALPFLISALIHTTYHNLRIYNLTPYNIAWQPPAIYDNEANLVSMPVSGDGSGSWDYNIPAIGSFSPPGGQSVTIANEASFAFASTSGFAGFAYVLPMVLTDPSTGSGLAEAAALFDLPWGTDNSLYGSFLELDPDDLFQNWDGQLKQTQYSSSTTMPDGNLVTMTLTYDYISGEHENPEGQSAYLYNSLLVFAVTSSSA